MSAGTWTYLEPVLVSREAARKITVYSLYVEFERKSGSKEVLLEITPGNLVNGNFEAGTKTDVPRFALSHNLSMEFSDIYDHVSVQAKYLKADVDAEPKFTRMQILIELLDLWESQWSRTSNKEIQKELMIAMEVLKRTYATNELIPGLTYAVLRRMAEAPIELEAISDATGTA